jgi:hypothetical protein
LEFSVTWALTIMLLLGLFLVILLGFSLGKMARQGDDEMMAKLKEADSKKVKGPANLKQRKEPED